MYHDRTPKERLDYVIQETWKILIAYYEKEKRHMTVENTFTLNFASILDKLLNVHLYHRHEFYDLVCEESPKHGRDRIDLVAYLMVEGETTRAAIEFKAPKKKNGADDEVRIDIYRDMQRGEQRILQDGYDLAYVLVLTDHDLHSKPSIKPNSTASQFPLLQHTSTSPSFDQKPKLKSRSHIHIQLAYEHRIDWTTLTYHYLKMDIHDPILPLKP